MQVAIDVLKTEITKLEGQKTDVQKQIDKVTGKFKKTLSDLDNKITSLNDDLKQISGLAEPIK